MNYKMIKLKRMKIKALVLILLLITCIIGSLILTFILGIKMKEERKKRANESKDDNYEYLSHPKEKFIFKSNQIILFLIYFLKKD